MVLLEGVAACPHREVPAASARRHCRRLQQISTHLVKTPTTHGTMAHLLVVAAAAARPAAASDEKDSDLKRLFGAQAYSEGPLMTRSGSGRRFFGIDLALPLTPPQVTFLLDSLASNRLICVAGQDLSRFSLRHFERFANHWGAVLPHPSNCVDPYVKGPPGAIKFLPVDRRRAAVVNETFPGRLQALPHDSPAVLTVSNFGGPPDSPKAVGPATSAGGGFHTDIEYEPLPIHVSMFLVHTAPTARDAAGGTWVESPHHDDVADGAPDVRRLRRSLQPLNGETAYIDTAAAFAALPACEQQELEKLQVWRQNPGSSPSRWLHPLVRTNPRSGAKSLHSPNSFRKEFPIRVNAMDEQSSQRLLDRLELHILQPQFRYNHPHAPGDVTLWDLWSTMHATPPMLRGVTRVEDARLMYRLSCKGDPCLSLPRSDSQTWLDQHISGGYSTPSSMLTL